MRAASGEPRYIEPTWTGRLKFALAYLGFAAWLGSHIVWVPRLLARVDSCNPCAAMAEIQFVFAYLMLVPSVAAILLGWRAWQVHRAGQFPMPGAWLLFRQRVWTGAWAQATAAFFAITAFFLATLPARLWRGMHGADVFFNHGC